MNPEVLLVAGTRAEAITLAPVAAEMRRADRLRPLLAVTGQLPAIHEALAAFGDRPDVPLGFDGGDGGALALVSGLARALDAYLSTAPPAAVVVSGDSWATLAGAMAAFWRQIPVVHLGAGLRSGDLAGPFPDEGHRRMVTQLSRLHLAPTASAAGNLLHEGVPAERVLITGSTAVDAALRVAHLRAPLDEPALGKAIAAAEAGRTRLVTLTAHRPESWGAPLDRVLRAVRRILDAYPDVRVVVPAPANPAVRAQVASRLAGARAVVTGPLPYASMTRLLACSYLVLTDSGGIQEEAPTFRAPVLVLRTVTERMESVRAGCARLVGTAEDLILSQARELLDDRRVHAAMRSAPNPYGDGAAAGRVEQALAALLGLGSGATPDGGRSDYGKRLIEYAS